jgi:hypothetical protein
MPQLDPQGLMGNAEVGTDGVPRIGTLPEIPIAAMAMRTMATIALGTQQSPGLPMKACALVANGSRVHHGWFTVKILEWNIRLPN